MYPIFEILSGKVAIMDVKIKNIEVYINDEICLVNLRWMRGASRYNNGGNRNGKLLKSKHPLRLILGRLKDHPEKIN